MEEKPNITVQTTPGTVTIDVDQNGINHTVTQAVVSDNLQNVDNVANNPTYPQTRDGAPDGNSNAEKYKTPEERKALCAAWCTHLEQGFSKESFPMCDPQTIREYAKKYPVDFDTDKMEQAERKGRLFWETVGRNGTFGKPIVFNGKEYNKFNAVSWQFNMMNRYPDKWKNRQDVTSNDDKLEVSFHPSLKQNE